jgi:malonyl-CoA/methylmalonyl-CoA synthetase
VVTRDGTAEVTEDAVLQGLKGRLANFKLPKRVFFVDELPRNAMGKVQKNALRERFDGTFGAERAAR